MLSKRTLIILVVIVIVIIGLAIALMLVGGGIFGPLKKDTPPILNENINKSTVDKLPKTQEKEEPVIVLTPAEQYITTVARNFAERFGSFSTDSKYANLEEVKLLSSAKLSKELQEMIESGDEVEIFYGITSKVLKVKINQLDEATGVATVMVTLQREETRQETTVFYQDLELSLISSGNEWLVNDFEWQLLD